MTTCFATIVSANYLAYARTLGESLVRHHPEAAFTVLVVDRPTPEVVGACASTGLACVYAESLGLDGFDGLAFKYDLVELNTALKPSFLKYLLDADAGRSAVVYLDPDIKVYAPLTVVTDALRHASITVTPHALAPALDGERPSDIDFLRNGAYNLGFIGVSRSAEGRRFLDWWEQRCLHHGFNDLPFGTFVDQKWLDLAPSYFDGVRVLRDATLNCAYWNLHERRIEGEPERPRVNGEPLAFFHFSGVKSSAPGVLSRHQTRHRLTPGTPLAALVRAYCDDLVRLGHDRYARLDYTYGRFDDGVAIAPLARRVATVVPAAGSPFSSAGPVRACCASLGLTGAPPATAVAPSTNTMSFDASSRPIRVVNAAVRCLARCIGLPRLALLVRYFGVLGRGANLTRIVMGVPLDLAHSPRPAPDEAP